MLGELEALVFCSDKIPTAKFSTSGGGLRSFQIMSLLHSLGIRVYYSIPESTSSDAPETEDFSFVGFYNLDNQKDFVENHNFDMIWWCNPGTVGRNVCHNHEKSLFCVDFHGPTNLETTFVTGESLENATSRIAESLQKVNLFTFVSEEQRNYWLGLLCSKGIYPDSAYGEVVNLSLPRAKSEYKIGDKIRFAFVGGWHPWLVDEELLIDVASTIAGEQNAELHFLGGTHEFNQNRYGDLISHLKKFETVHFHGFLPHSEYISFMQDSSCALDIFSKSYERKIAIPTRSVEFISNSFPLLHPKWTQISDIIKKNNCGFIYEDKKDLCDKIRFLSRRPCHLSRASSNSYRVASEHFNFYKSRRKMKKALGKWLNNSKCILKCKSINYFHISSENKPSVLWITFIPKGAPLRYLRVENILYSLFENGHISGFGIQSGKNVEIVGDVKDFDTVILQREGTNNFKLREEIFKDKFILDIDDLLFTNPGYRQIDYNEWKRKHYDQTKELVNKCFRMSVTSIRLTNLISDYTNLVCQPKSRVIPNSLLFPSNIPIYSEQYAEAMLWTSSDFAALDKSRDQILNACVDFCKSRDLKVYFFGKFDENLSSRFKESQNFGMVNFLYHKQILERLCGRVIAVAPLETKSDKSTLDFISGKSDLKMIEYGGYGIEAIYSKSPAYEDSDLFARHVVDNNYEDWVSALQSCYERPMLPVEVIQDIRDKRDVSNVSSESWLPLIQESIRRKKIQLHKLDSLLNDSKLLSFLKF